MIAPAQTIRQILEGRGLCPRGGDDRFESRCPAHEDKNPSLSVRTGADGKALVYCHAGCTFESVIASIGLAPADLFEPDTTPPPTNGHKPQRTYDYVDENGSLLYQVVRTDPKVFSQRRPDGRGGWANNINSVRRVLYRLPEVIATVKDHGTVYIVEGEKDADTINALEDAGNVIATSISGGAIAKPDTEGRKWRPEFTELLRGADVVIVADKDGPGRNHAAFIASVLVGIAGGVRVVEAAEGKDASDHLAAGHGLDDFVVTKDFRPKVEAPQDDTDIESWPEPCRQEAFYGPLGSLVHLIEPHTEADPVGILAQLLVGFGSLVGGSPFYRVEGSQHRVHEFLALIGRTAGGRKGTSWDQARRCLSALDEGWAQDRIQGGMSSGEGLIYAIRDPVKQSVPVKEKKVIVGYEEITADPGVSDKRLLAYEPEFARVLAVMSRDGNTLSTIIRQAWDGPILRVMTKAAVASTGAHVSVIAHITSEELLRQLQQTEAANGFGNRFLWVAVKRARLLPDGGFFETEQAELFLGRLRDAVDLARLTTEMSRDSACAELWRETYPRLTSGKPGLLGAMLSRAEAHVLRLSMIYALADKTAVIGVQHLQAALALWDYCARSAAFVFGDSLGDPTADEILRALRKAPDGMSRTQLRDHFHRNKPGTEIDRALTVLSRQGMAVSRKVPGSGPKPTEVWVSAS